MGYGRRAAGSDPDCVGNSAVQIDILLAQPRAMRAGVGDCKNDALGQLLLNVEVPLLHKALPEIRSQSNATYRCTSPDSAVYCLEGTPSKALAWLAQSVAVARKRVRIGIGRIFVRPGCAARSSDIVIHAITTANHGVPKLRGAECKADARFSVTPVRLDTDVAVAARGRLRIFCSLQSRGLRNGFALPKAAW